MDQSSFGNLGSCGGGGVIRDDKGNFVAGFSASYGMGTNTRGELQAVQYGLLLCMQGRLFSVQLESDSKMIVDWLQGKALPYALQDIWEEISSCYSTLTCYKIFGAVADCTC